VSQVRIAESLGVSRTPLREALRLLQREGLVEGEPHRRMRIASFSIPDMEATYVARVLLESVAVRVTAPLLTSEDFSQLEADMTRMAYFAQAADFESWEGPHRSFHRRLVAGAGDRLVAHIMQLSDHCDRYRRLHIGAARRVAQIDTEHRGILQACRSGDANEAAARLAHHLSRVVLDLIEMSNVGSQAFALGVALQLAETPVSSTRVKA
jgi:DNA-binding GntR family transcriptional regulator